MTELLFLLLPIAASYGWYMGRRSSHQNTQKQNNDFSRRYVAGLNHLLANESDKAVEVLIQLLDVDDDTLETHIALGNLFRQRGDINRAIKIHKTLISRDLTKEQRHLALQELAKDYLAAGLLDRAESIWLTLCEDPDFEQIALEQLLIIYQQLRDWSAAIDAAIQLQQHDDYNLSVTIGHFYCELAELDLRQGGKNEAHKKWQTALRYDASCVRAALQQGRLYMAEHDYSAAITALLPIIDQDPTLVYLAVPLLKECYYAQSNSKGLIELFQHWSQRQSSTTLNLALAELMEKHDNIEAAENILLQQLRQNPSLRGFLQWINYQIKGAEDGNAKESLLLLSQLIKMQIKVKPTHQCKQCGFSTHSLFWQCPSCRNWSTVKPIYGLDGE